MPNPCHACESAEATITVDTPMGPVPACDLCWWSASKFAAANVARGRHGLEPLDRPEADYVPREKLTAGDMAELRDDLEDDCG
jgi:hypothetical protein